MQVAKIRYNDIDAPAMFADSLQKTGFGVIADHPIHFDLVDCVYREWESFFQSKKKHDYLFDPIKQDGYFPTGTENAKGYPIKDHKEFYHFYPWGRVPHNFTDATSELYGSLVKMTSSILEWIELELVPTELVFSLVCAIVKFLKNGKISFGMCPSKFR